MVIIKIAQKTTTETNHDLGGNGQNPPKTPKNGIFQSKKGVGK